MFVWSLVVLLLRPAEEMVYISLDEESRTKGKAAIGVVGNQTGKSTGSLLQQFLLVIRCVGGKRASRGGERVGFCRSFCWWLGVRVGRVRSPPSQRWLGLDTLDTRARAA